MLSWKSSAWTVKKQLSTAIYFRKFLREISVIESFLWSNYRLAVQSSDYILNWLHQECFLGNLPKAFGAPKYHRSQIFETNLFLVAKVTTCGCQSFAYMKQIFPRIIFFLSQFPENLLVCNVLISTNKEVVQQKSHFKAMHSPKSVLKETHS